MKRYTDTISGEELYVDKGPGWEFYYKDREMTIYHRIDGPAATAAAGDKAWFVDNKRHRIDGPAIEYTGGDKSWYVNNVFIMMLDKDGKIIERME